MLPIQMLTFSCILSSTSTTPQPIVPAGTNLPHTDAEEFLIQPIAFRRRADRQTRR